MIRFPPKYDWFVWIYVGIVHWCVSYTFFNQWLTISATITSSNWVVRVIQLRACHSIRRRILERNSSLFVLGEEWGRFLEESQLFSSWMKGKFGWNPSFVSNEWIWWNPTSVVAKWEGGRMIKDVCFSKNTFLIFPCVYFIIFSTIYHISCHNRCVHY